MNLQDEFPNIKSCPFCGSDNLHFLKLDGVWTVKCFSCFAEGPQVSAGECNDPDVRAVELWNNRISRTTPCVGGSDFAPGESSAEMVLSVVEL